MKRQVRIKVGQVVALAEFYETKTADAIWESLPLGSNIHTWGEEIYFSISLKLELEAGREVVEMGNLGYWPPGNAFCIFFGPTPVSRPGEIRAASAVDVFGSLVDDPKVFRKVKDGGNIVVERP